MKNNFTFLLLLVFVGISMPAFAHEGSIRGRITDSETSKPSRALIYIEELNAGSTADVFGSFLVGLGNGDWTARGK